MFPIKNVLEKKMLCHHCFSLIRKVSGNQEGFKLNGIHQLLVYAVSINILDDSIHTIKKNTPNTEALVVVSKGICMEVNAEKTKYMVMSQDQHAG
jgi:hypothetical protein